MNKKMKMSKEQTQKEDGRYLIYYTFTDESEVGESKIAEQSQENSEQKQ